MKVYVVFLEINGSDSDIDRIISVTNSAEKAEEICNNFDVSKISNGLSCKYTEFEMEEK
jgi:hypothetical protein